MSLQTWISLYNFVWSLEANAQQRLAWEDGRGEGCQSAGRSPR